MSSYVGRFAPSPSGPLHFGSIVAALASYLDARAQGGRWLLRIDDIDPPREQAGASDSILKTLDQLGLHWDGAVVFQSERHEAYDTALALLDEHNLTFPCACSRKDIGGGAYPGTCWPQIAAGRVARTLRLRVTLGDIHFIDRIQGQTTQRLREEVGDFVLVRRGGYYAYHLAAVVDDGAAGVNQIVRGVDLIDSTPRQIYLQQLLGLPTPIYAHIPTVLNTHGTKLSKQTGACGVNSSKPSAVLLDALRFLRQPLDRSLQRAGTAEILQWAVEHWSDAALGRDSRTLEAISSP